MTSQYPQPQYPPPQGDSAGGSELPNYGGGCSDQPSTERRTLADDVDATGLFTGLFDFSFAHLITPKIVRFVYLLAALTGGFVWVFTVIALFTHDVGAGLVALLFGPFVGLLWLAFVRLMLEFFLAMVRMSEDIHRRLPPM